MLFAGGVAMAALAIVVAMEAMIPKSDASGVATAICTRTARSRATGQHPGRGDGGRMRRGLLALAAIVCGSLSLFDIAAHGEGQVAREHALGARRRARRVARLGGA